MSDTYKRLATGQLADSSGDLYTAPTKCVEPSLLLFNTGVSTETVNIYLYDGTDSWQVAKLDIPADGSAVVTFDKVTLEIGDKVQGDTTTATTVNYWLSGVEI